MKTITQKSKRFHYFPDYNEWLDTLDKGKMEQNCKANYMVLTPSNFKRLVDPDDQREWCGGVNFDEAKEKALRGVEISPETLEIKDSITNKISEQYENTFAWDVTGESVDVGAFLSNEPECMLTTREEAVAKPTATIFYNCGVSGGVKADTLQFRGLAILALVDTLASIGYAVELYIGDMFRNGGWLKGGVIIKLLDSSHPYDPQLVSFALSSPAMLRKLLFGYYLTIDKDTANHWGVDGGYGYPDTLDKLPEEITDGLNVNTESGLALTEGDLAGLQIGDMESAISWVQSQINRLTKN